MEQLNRCISLVREIEDIDERISEIEARCISPKGQRITGMPRGGTIGNQTENYMVKLEALASRRIKLVNLRFEAWKEAQSIFTENSVNSEYIQLLWYRFFCGYQWKVCNEFMKEKYPDHKWNINKCFRVYRSITKKCDNSQLTKK